MKTEKENITEKAEMDPSENNPKEDGFRMASLKDLLSGNLLTREVVLRQLPFVLFLFVLTLFYIGNRYHAIKMTRDTLRLQNELKELRANAISKASELMFLSRQSQILEMVKKHELELKESRVPPKILKP